MSVTYYPSDVKWETKQVPCSSPGYGLTCTAEERCGYCQDGWETKDSHEGPDVHLSNYNARRIQRLLGLDTEEWGEVAHQDIPSVLQRIMVVLNREQSRAHLVEGASDFRSEITTKMVVNGDGMPEIQSQGGCRMVSGGNTDADTLRRVRGLREVFIWAHKNNSGVVWG